MEDRLHVHDIHASILWLLGMDHLQLTYLHNGRAERPTSVRPKTLTITSPCGSAAASLIARREGLLTDMVAQQA